MRWTRHGSITLVILLCTVAPAGAQERAARSEEPSAPSSLSREVEVALARSAAPAAVSADATVLVLEGERYVVAEEGTNGVTCYVSRSHPQSLEPHCFDAEGSATILPIHLRRAELRARGAGDEEIEAQIARALADGELRLPRRPVLSYMMSSAQVLYNDDGERVGRWKPHIMIYYPHLDRAELGLGETPAPPAFLFGEGSPTSSLVVVVPEFVDPEVPVDR